MDVLDCSIFEFPSYGNRISAAKWPVSQDYYIAYIDDCGRCSLTEMGIKEFVDDTMRFIDTMVPGDGCSIIPIDKPIVHIEFHDDELICVTYDGDIYTYSMDSLKMEAPGAINPEFSSIMSPFIISGVRRIYNIPLDLSVTTIDIDTGELVGRRRMDERENTMSSLVYKSVGHVPLVDGTLYIDSGRGGFTRYISKTPFVGYTPDYDAIMEDGRVYNYKDGTFSKYDCVVWSMDRNMYGVTTMISSDGTVTMTTGRSTQRFKIDEIPDYIFTTEFENSLYLFGLFDDVVKHIKRYDSGMNLVYAGASIMNRDYLVGESFRMHVYER